MSYYAAPPELRVAGDLPPSNPRCYRSKVRTTEQSSTSRFLPTPTMAVAEMYGVWVAEVGLGERAGTYMGNCVALHGFVSTPGYFAGLCSRNVKPCHGTTSRRLGLGGGASRVWRLASGRC